MKNNMRKSRKTNGKYLTSHRDKLGNKKPNTNIMITKKKLYLN